MSNGGDNSPPTKVCRRCGGIKSLEEFVKDRRNKKDGRDTICYICNRKRNLLESEVSRKLRDMLRGAKRRCKKTGRVFAISKKDVDRLYCERCPVLGIPLDWEYGNGVTDNSPTLDRVDNARGYEPGNIKIISFRANRLKSVMSLDEVEQIYNYIKMGYSGPDSNHEN